MRFSLILISTLFIVSSFAQSNWNELTVIGNNTGLNSINKDDLKEVFLGNVTSWPNKNNVTIVLPSTKYYNADSLITLALNKSHNTLRRYWLSLVFQGRANPPIYLDSNEAILKFVTENKGAIAMMIGYKGPELDNLLIIEEK